MTIRRCFLLFVVGLSAACGLAQNLSRAELVRRRMYESDGHDVLVLSHRGDCRELPENSAEAFRAALALGVDAIELDVRRTSDGKFVVLHNATLEQMTDGSGLVSERTLDEIRALHLKASHGGTNEQLTACHPISLEEALEIVRGKAMVNIDKFGECPREIVRAVKNVGMLRSVFVFVNGSPETVRERLGEDVWALVKSGELMVMPSSLCEFRATRREDASIRARREAWRTSGIPIPKCVYVCSMWDKGCFGHGEGDRYYPRRTLLRVDQPDFVWGWAIDGGATMIMTDFAPELISYLRLRFLRDLIAIPSVSADVEQVNRATRMVSGYLKRRGLHCTVERHPSGRETLFASTVPGKSPDFVLCPHLDVVPAVEQAQYAMKVEGDRIVGRGSSDCKGQALSAIEALVRLMREGGVSVGCIFGADEEIGGATTTWMVEEMGYRPKRMALIVDGSADCIRYAIKGAAVLEMSARGRGGHSSHPWEFDDSILTLSEAYVKLRKAWDLKHPLTDDRWCDVLSATIVRSDGTAANRLPDEATMVLNLRTVSSNGRDEAMEFVRAETGLDVRCRSWSRPFESDPSHPLVVLLRQTMAESEGREIGLKRSGAANDSRCFVACAVPAVSLGPQGGGAHAHDEWVSCSGIDRTADILVRFLKAATEGKGDADAP